MAMPAALAGAGRRDYQLGVDFSTRAAARRI
jgi:hypothetical protein